jgi:hypothetical protein
MSWDGDALAGQLEDAQERAEIAAEERARAKERAGVDLAREAELESLRLSKSRISEQLQRATNPAHKSMLQRALADIERKMQG